MFGSITQVSPPRQWRPVGKLIPQYSIFIISENNDLLTLNGNIKKHRSVDGRDRSANSPFDMVFRPVLRDLQFSFYVFEWPLGKKRKKKETRE